jgi:hypothetical protein
MFSLPFGGRSLSPSSQKTALRNSSGRPELTRIGCGPWKRLFLAIAGNGSACAAIVANSGKRPRHLAADLCRPIAGLRLSEVSDLLHCVRRLMARNGQSDAKIRRLLLDEERTSDLGAAASVCDPLRIFLTDAKILH